MNGGNVTWLFEGQIPARGEFPVSEEHFWTAIFALFLLHLGEARGETQLSIFRCRQPGRQDPWPCFESRRESPGLDVYGVGFEDIAVEPDRVPLHCFDPGFDVPIEIGGFRPDVFVRVNKTIAHEKPRFFAVENKRGGRWGDGLSRAQMENYPRLIRYLADNGIDCQFLLLMSLGCSDNGRLWEQAVTLQDDLKAKFGILLWEDVIRHMERTQFRLAGIDIGEWRRKYTDDLDKAVEGYDVPQA